MARKIKLLILTIVASCAMGTTASVAVATELTASSYPVNVSGLQSPESPHSLTMDGYTSSCKNAEFAGTSGGPSTTLTLTPKFTECTSFGLNAARNMNGCDFLVHLPSGGATHVLATVDLVCPAGKAMTISAGGGLCVSHIPPFTGRSHLTITNSHPNLTASWTLSGITAQLTDTGGGFCPFTGNTTVNNATYDGHLILTGSGKTISLSA